MKVFVDSDSDTRLCRRIKRDVAERGRDVEGILNQYFKFVKPAFEEYIQPSMKHADLIVPRGVENTVAINLIVNHVRDTLRARGARITWDTKPLTSTPKNVRILPQTHQTNALLTILRNRETDIGDFVFYSDRLNRLLFEFALDVLPVRSHSVTTPTGELYNGESFVERVCAVSIFRAGSCMENPLKEILEGIPIGQLLIQSDKKKIPRLFHYKLPQRLAESHIFLLEPTVATAATVKMAIQTLLDNGADQQKITLVSVVAATHGLHSIAHTYPFVSIVTAAVDHELDSKGYIVPGIGNYADRYLGTEDTD